MQLTEDFNTATYQIQSATDNRITINGTAHECSLIISQNKLIVPWGPSDVTTLTDEALLALLTCKPDIILLGTGKKSIILSHQKLAVLLERQFHVECMNTAAACRTYTVLSAENRNVVAGLLLE